jgi:hypothetical protein
MLVASTNIGRDDAENYPVVDFFTVWRNKLRIVNTSNFDFSWSEVDDTAISVHRKNFYWVRRL